MRAPFFFPILGFFLLSLLPSPAAALVSDDFFIAGIDFSRWELIDPRGDADFEVVGAGSADARLQISIPAGLPHDLWSDGLFAPRLRQPCGSDDFTVEVKFESALQSRFQTQGLLAEGPDGALRFEFLGDGAGTRLFAAEVRPGSASTKLNKTITGGVPLYMRVARAGSRWTQTYSYDGQTWLAGASFTTSLPMTNIGVYGGNAGSPAPAHTALIDYVFDLAAPIDPEDAGSGSDLSPPEIFEVTSLPRSASALIAWKTDEPATGEIEYGLPGADTPLGTVSAPVEGSSQSVELLNLEPDTEYRFRILAWDAAGNLATSDGHAFRTAVPSTCNINLWYGPFQVFGRPGIAQRWVNLLGDVAQCPDLASLAYRLNGGAERSLSVGPDGRRLVSPGDFNIDIDHADLVDGSNLVEVIAEDVNGQVTTQAVQIDWRGETWPLPYLIDWGNVARVQDAVQVVDGKWRIEDPAVRTEALGYDRLLAIGDLSWTDYDALFDFTVLTVDPTGYTNPASWAPGLGFQMRWQGHTDQISGQPLAGWLPVGASVWYEWNDRFRLYLNGRSSTAEPTGRRVALDTRYLARMRVETLATGEPHYRFRFWPADQAEPTAWDMEGTGRTTDPKRGSFLLVAHHLDMRFGSVSLSPTGTDNTPPAISAISSSPTSTAATITWTTDEPARGGVEYGLSTSFGTSIQEADFSTDHTLSLTGLQPDTLYYYRVSAADSAGNQAYSETLDFRTAAAVSYTLTTAVVGQGSVSRSPDQDSYAAGETVTLTTTPASGWAFSGWSGDLGGTANPASVTMDGDLAVTATFVESTSPDEPPYTDEFNDSSLDATLWSFVDPLGDATVTLGDGRAAIRVPAGASHDLWSHGNYAPRLLQPAPAGDFEVEAKFDSAIPARFQMQGIIVEETTDTFLRCEFLGDGSGTRLFVAMVSPGSASVKADRRISSGTPRYMRVKRQGDGWTVTWSVDGTDWTAGAAFSQPLAAAAVGVHAGNAGTNPEHTALVDYFRNTTVPPLIEHTLTTAVNGQGSVSRSPDQDSYAAGETVTLTATAADGWVFSGWSGDLGGTANPASLTMDGDLSVTATFVEPASPSEPPYSDEFNSSSLDSTLWSFVNPLGDGSVALVDGRAAIRVPAGASHDLWTHGNYAPRLLQPAPAGDFEVEAKFDSTIPARFQMQGIIVEETAATFLRCEFLGDGSGTRLFVAMVSPGSASVKADRRISSGTPRYMRVKRQGDGWTVTWSVDGTDWTAGAAFSQPLAAAAVGVYAGNAGGNPEHTALVDWFRSR